MNDDATRLCDNCADEPAPATIACRDVWTDPHEHGDRPCDLMLCTWCAGVLMGNLEKVRGAEHRPAATWPRGEPMLLCSSCRHADTTAVGMNEHTSSRHGRRPTIEERTPLTPDERDAVLAAIS